MGEKQQKSAWEKKGGIQGPFTQQIVEQKKIKQNKRKTWSFVEKARAFLTDEIVLFG